MRQPLTREAIAAAARQILVTEGLQGVSLRRVAASLGVTAPALYAHVVDKRDLLQGIVEQELDEMLRRFREVQADEGVERLRLQAEAYVDYACQNPDLVRAMFLFRPELTAEPRGEQPPLARLMIDAFTDTARTARDQGHLTDVEPQLAGLTVWTAAHGVVTVLLSGPPIDLDLRAQLAHTAIEAAIKGLDQRETVQAA